MHFILPGRYFFTEDGDIHLIANSRRELRDGINILAKSTTFQIVTILLVLSYGQTVSLHNSEHYIDQDRKL